VEGSGILLTHMIGGWNDYKWGNLSPTCMPLVSFVYEGCASFLFYKIITYQNKTKKNVCHWWPLKSQHKYSYIVVCHLFTQLSNSLVIISK
jgi:hypothetical protein